MWVTKLMNPCDDKTNFHDDTMIKKTVCIPMMQNTHYNTMTKNSQVHIT